MTVAEVDDMQARIIAGEFGSPDGQDASERHIVLTPASAIEVKPVHWLWKERIPLGELALLAGREGIGKSTVAYTLAAWITTGTMKGVYIGQPRSVIVAATEDSWEHTIVPRLMGAGADLDRVYRCEVELAEGIDGYLTLPKDIPAMEKKVAETDAALLLLDPLMSRLSASLDSHRDAEVRQALEPMVAFAKRSGISVLGLIHVNKGASTDALNLIMGSRAFPAVARAVMIAMKDPDDENKRILGLEKSNLGSTEVPAYSYQIVGKHVADTTEGPVYTGAVDWLGDSPRTISEALMAASDGPDGGTATTEAAHWLEDYLKMAKEPKASMEVKKAGRAAGHSDSAIQRARKNLKIVVTTTGFPRTSVWELPWYDGEPTKQDSTTPAPRKSTLADIVTDGTESPF